MRHAFNPGPEPTALHPCAHISYTGTAGRMRAPLQAQPLASGALPLQQPLLQLRRWHGRRWALLGLQPSSSRLYFVKEQQMIDPPVSYEDA